MLTRQEVEQENQAARDRLLTQLHRWHPLASLPGWMDERNQDHDQ